jgi:hypothetical protein
MEHDLKGIEKAANRMLDLGQPFSLCGARIVGINRPGSPAYQVSCEGRLFCLGDRGRAVSDFLMLLQRHAWPSEWEPWASYKDRLYLLEDEEGPQATLPVRHTHFACLAEEGETENLIFETRQATILDMRVAGDLPTPAWNEIERREVDSDSEYLSRAWRFILPGQDAADALVLRTRHGWSHEEVLHIRNLLLMSSITLYHLTEHAILSGTRSTLRLHAERVDALRNKWASLLDPNKD